MRDFIIRPYESGDEEAINEAFNHVFGLQRPLDEWHWKFQPSSDRSRIMIAVDTEGQIIAHFSAIQVPAQVGDRSLMIGHTVDAFCIRSSDSVGQRVYIKLVNEFYERYGGPGGLAFLYGFPGERHLRLGRLKLQFAMPLPVRMISCCKKVARSSWLHRYDVKSWYDSTAMDLLWQRSAHRYRVSVIRDSSWIERRYLSHPNNPYILLSAVKRSSVRGWALLRPDGPIVSIVDFLWDGEDRRVIVELEEKIVQIARLKGAIDLQMWLCGDEEVEKEFILKGWSPVQHPQGLHRTAVSFDPLLRSQDMVDEFYITMGDSDLF